MSDIQAAAASIGQRLDILIAGSESDIDNAFARLTELRPGALVVQSEPFFNSRRDQIVTLSARNVLLAIYPAREFVTAGGLMSYAVSIADVFRQTGI